MQRVHGAAEDSGWTEPLLGPRWKGLLHLLTLQAPPVLRNFSLEGSVKEGVGGSEAEGGS